MRFKACGVRHRWCMRCMRRHAPPYPEASSSLSDDNMLRLLPTYGVEVILFSKNSAEISKNIADKLKAAFNSIYSFSAYKNIVEIIKHEKPDLVHVHNVYPLISPSVLIACRREKIPVVMTCHNYRLICPTGIHYTNGRICERCSGGKEYWCILKNCRHSISESTAYALRNLIARNLKIIKFYAFR